MKIISITQQCFQEEVLGSEIPVLVDFYADWCHNCKDFSAVMEALADEITDVKICMVNTSEAEEISQKFNIEALPTVILFRNGEVAAASEGAVVRDGTACRGIQLFSRSHIP